MTTDFLLSFDGTYCSGPNGMDYSGGRKKLLKIDGFVTYNILHVAIRRKLGMSNNEYINRIIHRLPVAYGPPIEYIYMEVSDDDDVSTIIAVGRDFPTVKYITLYIEKQIMDAPQFGYQGSHEGFGNRANNSELMDNMQYMDYASGPSRVNDFDMNCAPPIEPEYEYTSPGVQHPRMDFSVQDVNVVVETPFQYANFDTSDDEEEPHLHAVEDEEGQSLIMYDEGWVVNNQEEGIKDATLNEDMIWATKEEMIRSVKRYSWKVNCDYHVVESKKHCWVVQCLLAGEGCQWYFRGSLKKGQLTHWGVAKYRQPHTCMANRTTEDHRQLDSKFIAQYIRRRVEGQPTIPILSIITEVHDNLKIKPSYKKAWDAKQKAMAMIWGGWKESYNMLPRWFAACQAANPGTVVEWEYSYCYPGTMNYLPRGTRMFHRVFWAFKPCIDAFKKCFPILFIDGTWLYGKYKQILLVATAIDGNNAIIPICFALVESENTSSWPWFLLQIKLHITDPAGICIISDRHPGIRKAMTTDICGWGPSSGAVWRYCLRHVASNYNTKFKCDRIKNLMKVAGQRSQQRKLDNCLNRIKAAHMESYLWIEKVGLERWALAKDGGYRYGHMTTNISECMNNVFKKVRHLPVAALVTETFNKLRVYFEKRQASCTQALDNGELYSERLNACLQRWRTKARGHEVSTYNHQLGIFEVETGWDAWTQTGRHKFEVNLNTRECQCGKFQALHYPCSHAIACCTRLRLDDKQFIDPRFMMENTRSCYDTLFHPLGNEAYWPPVEDFRLIPDLTLRRTVGHPKKRIHNEMDEDDAPETVCSLCHGEGHSARHCTNVESLGQTSGTTSRRP